MTGSSEGENQHGQENVPKPTKPTFNRSTKRILEAAKRNHQKQKNSLQEWSIILPAERRKPMEHNGWIKLYRELLHKAIWKDSTSEQKVILITLLLMANHTETEWEWKGSRFCCTPGQFRTSLESIVSASGKGISVQNVRTALKKFKRYGFLTDESTRTGRLITICNWEQYQVPEEEHNKASPNPLTDDQQTANRPLTPNKNNKNDKNDKKERSKAEKPSLLPEDAWYQEDQSGRNST